MAKATVIDEVEEEFSVEIDPALIEAAVAAVDGRARDARARRAASTPAESEADPITVEVGQAPGPTESSPARPRSVTPEERPRSVTPEERPRSVTPEERPRSVTPEERPWSVPPEERPQSPAPEERVAGRRLESTAALGFAAVDEQRRMWQHRARESAERVRRLESELAEANENREQLDQMYREARQAGQQLHQDMELARQRARRDRDEAERVGEERVLRGLLDIVENVERGVAHAAQDPERVLSGLNMVAEQFRMLLKRVGIERVEASPGTPFDPAEHEAVLHMPSSEVLPGTVHNEVAPGFKLRGRLVRPARVVVASAPPDGE